MDAIIAKMYKCVLFLNTFLTSIRKIDGIELWKVSTQNFNLGKSLYDKVSVLPSHQRTKMAILIPFRKRSLFIVSWCILVWKQKIYNISTNDFTFPPQIPILLYKCSPAFTFWKNIKLRLKKTYAGWKMQQIDWGLFFHIQNCSRIQGKIVS